MTRESSADAATPEQPSRLMTAHDPLGALALSVARCQEVEPARSSAHPCSTIVGLQPSSPSRWQVPEAWAGALGTAKILFVSSNPSIKETELYPRGDWSDEAIVDFVTHRFDSVSDWATPSGYSRREDGSRSPSPVQFWVRVRKRAAELLGPDASPATDYAMTEVVHCKSKGEKGVAAAASRCAERHLDYIVAACPAPLVVVIGATARKQVSAPWRLPAGFGCHKAKGSSADGLVTRIIGGRQRLVAHLIHPAAQRKPQTFAETYPGRLEDLQRLVSGSLTVESFGGET